MSLLFILVVGVALAALVFIGISALRQKGQGRASQEYRDQPMAEKNRTPPDQP
ncbi:MAG: hypothetical protein RL095_2655 [Verrucomicrobiota bacterium]|jgi:hypothetical protein